ncbi:MAG: hypothetical protein Q7S09_05240 [bacterium]|nr:hypothetical protein [bacterium]
MPPEDSENYTWAEFEEDAKKIAVWAREKRFKSVYGIPRGGLILAVVLSHLLDVPVLLSREDITRDTLIVDDIVDGGKTVHGLLMSLGGTFNISSLFFNEASPVKPDFFVRTKKKWVVFPWETSETSRYDNVS